MNFAPIVVALIICFPTYLIADPKLDASSASAFTESVKNVINYAQQDPNIGNQDKILLRSFLTNDILLNEAVIAIQQLKDNPNASDNQKDALFLEHVKQYDGLTGAQIIARFHKEYADKIAQDKSKQEGQKQNLKDANSIILDWLEGRDTPVGLPGMPGFSCKLTGKNNDTVEVGLGLSTDKHWQRLLSAKLNKSRTGYSTEKNTYMLDNNKVIPYDANKMNSLDQFDWFIPKFKEWVKKLNALPVENRPPILIKRFPLSSKQHSLPPSDCNGPTTVWYVYRKGIGSGVLIFNRELVKNAGYSVADLPSIVNECDRNFNSMWPQWGENGSELHTGFEWSGDRGKQGIAIPKESDLVLGLANTDMPI